MGNLMIANVLLQNKKMLNRSNSRISGGSVHQFAQETQNKYGDVDEEELRTLWCGGVSDKVDDEILYELFLNAGPLERVVIPKDRETKKQKNFAFIVFQHQESVKFAYDLLNGTELFRQPIKLQQKSTGLGIEQRGGYNQSRGGHQRSFTAPQTGFQNREVNYQAMHHSRSANTMGGFNVPHGYNNLVPFGLHIRSNAKVL